MALGDCVPGAPCEIGPDDLPMQRAYCCSRVMVTAPWVREVLSVARHWDNGVTLPHFLPVEPSAACWEAVALVQSEASALREVQRRRDDKARRIKEGLR